MISRTALSPDQYLQGETIPKEANHVRLHETLKDDWGIPLLVTSVSYDENDEPMIRDWRTEAAAMLEVAGCHHIQTTDNNNWFPRRDIHENGRVPHGAGSQDVAAQPGAHGTRGESRGRGAGEAEPLNDPDHMIPMTRREALKVATALVGRMLVTSAGGLSGCAPERRKGAAPGLLSFEDQELAEEIADTLLPTTAASPGAKAAGVGATINLLLTDCYVREAQQRVLQGCRRSEPSAAIAGGPPSRRSRHRSGSSSSGRSTPRRSGPGRRTGSGLYARSLSSRTSRPRWARRRLCGGCSTRGTVGRMRPARAGGGCVGVRVAPGFGAGLAQHPADGRCG